MHPIGIYHYFSESKRPLPHTNRGRTVKTLSIAFFATKTHMTEKGHLRVS